MHQGTRTRPATAGDFHRLAEIAHARGLRLFRDGPRWYCSSASAPGGCHYVTGFSCDCPGFITHQRCSHHALLLERLGWLPELPDDDPRPPVATVTLGPSLGRLSAEFAWSAGSSDVLRELVVAAVGWSSTGPLSSRAMCARGRASSRPDVLVVATV